MVQCRKTHTHSESGVSVSQHTGKEGQKWREAGLGSVASSTGAASCAPARHKHGSAAAAHAWVDGKACSVGMSAGSRLATAARRDIAAQAQQTAELGVQQKG